MQSDQSEYEQLMNMNISMHDNIVSTVNTVSTLQEPCAIFISKNQHLLDSILLTNDP